MSCAENKDTFGIYNLLIQAALFSEYGVSQKELESYLGLSYNSVRSRLQKIPQDLIIKITQGRHAYYMLDLDKVDLMFSK